MSTEVITSIAGSGSEGYSGDGDQATAANIAYPVGINLDSSGNVYFASFYVAYIIRKVNISTGIISTVAGTGSAGYNGDNIQATSAMLNYAQDVIVDSDGNLYISDLNNHRIRKVAVSTGLITTVVGTGTASSTGDGSDATSAAINGPCYSRFDSDGNFYVSECSGNRIRKVSNLATTVTPSNDTTASPSLAPTSSSNSSLSIITTVAGTGVASYSGDGGQATSADINTPTGITTDSSGNVYFCDSSNNRVRVINTNGIIYTVVGSSTDDDTSLNYPSGIAINNTEGKLNLLLHCIHRHS